MASYAGRIAPPGYPNTTLTPSRTRQSQSICAPVIVLLLMTSPSKPRHPHTVSYGPSSRDGANRRRRHEPRVLRHHAGLVPRRRRLPRRQAPRDLAIAQVDVQPPLRHVEHDDVAFPQRRNRSAARGFGRDMSDGEAARRAGKAAVRQERHGIAESGADNRRGDPEHLAHPRPAGRALVPDHDHVARLDRLTLNSLERLLLALEDARRAAMLGALGARELQHGAFRR